MVELETETKLCVDITLRTNKEGRDSLIKGLQCLNYEDWYNMLSNYYTEPADLAQDVDRIANALVGAALSTK